MEITPFVSTTSLGAGSPAVLLPTPLRHSHQNANYRWRLLSANPKRLDIIVKDSRSLTFWPNAALRGNVVEATRIPTSVPVRVANELAQAGHRYLDVRTPDEFSIGHPPGAVNIPYMFRVGSGMTKNAGFLSQVSTRFRKHDEIIVGCTSGQRSLKASADLLSAGFTAVTDIAGGYAAWTQNGLPIEE